MKILVVDNDRILNNFLSQILVKLGYEVVSAVDGLEALELLQKQQFDLLITDYIMQNVDGKTLCKFIRKMPELSKSYIVLMSAIATEEWKDFRTIGADVYMAKGPLNEMKENILWVIENMQEAASLCASGKIIGSENVHPRNITKELLTSKHHLELIINKTTEGIIEINGKGKIVFANPSILSLLKTKEFKIIGRYFLDIFSKPEKKRVENLWEKTEDTANKIDSDNPLNIEGNLVTLTIIPIENNSQGESALAIFTDITHLKKVEKELRNTNEFLGQILNSSFSTSIISTDLQQNILFWNKGSENLFGYKAEEVLGKNIDFLYPGINEKKEAQILRDRICMEKSEISTEIRELTKEGEVKWLKVNLSPILDNIGNVIGIQGMGEDITKRKIVEETLIESEMKFRAIFESAIDAIFIKNSNLQFALVNPAMQDLFNMPAENFLGKTENEVFRAEATLGLNSNERKVLSGEIVEEEVLWKNDTGGINLHIIKVPLYNAKNDVSGICGIARNVTDIKEMEKQLRQGLKMEAIGSLAGGIAHDFNNILAIIIGNTELAIGDIPEWNPAKENLKEIQTACLRAKDVVRQILSFSRKDVIGPKLIQIGPIIEDSLKMLRASIPADIEIRKNISCEFDTILADPTQMSQVLMNLCTNASHAMRDEGGILEVSLHNFDLEARNATLELGPGHYVKLVVSDTGHGIDPKSIDRIFDPYFTTKGLGEGTGLGLSVVQGIARAHNGAVTVKSEPEKGTVFEVLFPAIEGEMEPESEEIAVLPTLPTGNEKILFIDDEASILKLAKKRLEMQGYQVETKSSPVEALDLVRSEPDRFDLIITDMTMPQMTGDKLAKEILSIRPGMPIILCSGYNEKIDAKKAKKLGIRKYIEKPLDMSNFVVSIRKILDAGRSEA